MLKPGMLAAALAVLAAVVSSGCGGSDKSGAGVLVLSRLGVIEQFDIATGEVSLLVDVPEQNSFILDPAVSPDGERIAYIVQPPPRVVDGKYDAGSDLWIANRDGSEPRLLYEHEDLNALVRFPQWQGDGQVLAFVQDITFVEVVAGSGTTTIDYIIQRFEVASGEHETVLEDAIAFTLSPDGERISYSRLDQAIGEIFESAPLAGGEAQVLVAQDEQLQPYSSPRYSPDGTRIAFASADQTQAPPTGRLSAPARTTDGFPQDIWLVDAAGGKPRLLADLKEDLPSLTWSGDGKHIFVLGANGLYDIDVETGAVTLIGEGAFHGQLDWAQK
jgi:Tol biopolymer transport system component